MDVFLAAEAHLALAGLRLAAGRTRPKGLLLGHRRGPRYFVETVFAAGDDFRFRPDVIRRLDALFGGRVIGFFIFRPDPAIRRVLLRPSAVGRILVAVDGRGALSASAIDYDGRFLFTRLPLSVDKKGPNNG